MLSAPCESTFIEQGWCQGPDAVQVLRGVSVVRGGNVTSPSTKPWERNVISARICGFRGTGT